MFGLFIKTTDSSILHRRCGEFRTIRLLNMPSSHLVKKSVLLLLVSYNTSAIKSTKTFENPSFHHQYDRSSPATSTRSPAHIRKIQEQGLGRLSFDGNLEDLIHIGEDGDNNAINLSSSNSNNSTNRGLDLKFSLWHPTFRADNVADHDDVIQLVLAAIEEMLCEDTHIVLISTTSAGRNDNICPSSQRRRRRHHQRFLRPSSTRRGLQTNEQANDDDDQVLSVLSERNSVSISNNVTVVNQDSQMLQGPVTLLWTEWIVTYSIVTVGQQILSQLFVNMENKLETSDEQIIIEGEQMLDNVAQLALDVSIMEGTMDQRLDPISAYMSITGLELETFLSKEAVVDATSTTRTGTNGSPSGNNISGFSSQNQILSNHSEISFMRLLGALLIVCNTLVLISLNQLAKRRRSRRNKDMASSGGADNYKYGLDVNHNEFGGALSTAMSVDMMLEKGRKNSINALRESQEHTAREGSSSSSADQWAHEEHLTTTVRRKDDPRESIPSSSALEDGNKTSKFMSKTKSISMNKAKNKVQTTRSDANTAKKVRATSCLSAPSSDVLKEDMSSGSFDSKKSNTKRGTSKIVNVTEKPKSTSELSNGTTTDTRASSRPTNTALMSMPGKNSQLLDSPRPRGRDIVSPNTSANAKSSKHARASQLLATCKATSANALHNMESMKESSFSAANVKNTQSKRKSQTNVTDCKEDTAFSIGLGQRRPMSETSKGENMKQKGAKQISNPKKNRQEAKRVGSSRLSSSSRSSATERVDPKLRLGQKPISTTRRPSIQRKQQQPSGTNDNKSQLRKSQELRADDGRRAVSTMASDAIGIELVNGHWV